MDLKIIFPYVLRISVGLMIFSFALNLVPGDLILLIKTKPGKLIRSLISVNIVMPVFAAILVSLFNLDPAVKVAIVTLSLSPVAPGVTKDGLDFGGHIPYVFGLLFTSTLLSIVFFPAGVVAFGAIGGKDIQISPLPIIHMVLVTVLAPLVLGMIFRLYAQKIAEKIKKPVSSTASILLIAGTILMIISGVPDTIKLLSVSWYGTLASIAGFLVVGMIFGYALGGPEKEDRKVLALFTFSRHPGVAMATVAAIKPELVDAVLAAILIYTVLITFLGIPFLGWEKEKKPSSFADGD